jgi:hypothetical protein
MGESEYAIWVFWPFHLLINYLTCLQWHIRARKCNTMTYNRGYTFLQ